jgi:tetratricopeptide (TPR) repeat protein
MARASHREKTGRWLGLIVTAALACLATAPWPAVADGGKARVSSLNALAAMDPPSDCPKVEGKQVGAPNLNLAQAVERFNAAVEASLSPKSIQALDADPRARTTGAATAVAVDALLGRRPLAAAAYLLRAHLASPQDPDVLVNLASLANYFARHDEALAFVTAAAAVGRAPSPPWSMNGQATLLTVRGGALLGLDRAKEAEVALRQAITLQPDLSEAYTNLAYALGEQDRCPEAVMYLMAGAYRDPEGILEPDLGTGGGQGPGKPPAPPAKPPAPTQEADADRDVEDRCPPSKVAVDLARGKTATLPRLPVATKLEEVKPLWEALQKHKQLYAKEAEGLLAVGRAATAQLKPRAAREGNWLDEGTPSQRLTALRSRRLRHLVYCYTQNNSRQSDARLKRQYRMAADSLGDLGRRQQVALKRMGDAEKVAFDVNFSESSACTKIDDPRANKACGDRAEWKLYQALCKSAGAYLLEVAPNARAFDQAERSYFMEAYQAASAAASYQGVPESTAYSRWVLKQFENSEYGRVVGGAESALNPIATNSTRLQKMLRLCPLPEPPKVEAVAAPSNGPPTFCDLVGESKVKVDLELLEVSVGCEQVAVEVSVGKGVAGFVEVGADWSEEARKKGKAAAKAARVAAGKRDGSNPLGLEDMDRTDPIFEGTVTVFGGVKGKVTPYAEVKGGAYVVVDGHGDVTDFGVKGENTIGIMSPTKIEFGGEMGAGSRVFSFVSTPGAK